MEYRYVISGLWTVWFVYWFAKRWRNKPTLYRANRVAWVVAAIGTLLLWSLFDRYRHIFRQELFARTDTTRVIGIALCAAGIAFAIWARRVLGTNWSGNPTIKQGHELIRRGPYALVRHPIYTGLLLAVFGSAFGRGRLQDLVLVIYAFVCIGVKSRIEETLMLRQFPLDYPEYRKRTKALIPRVL
jgi:protein-S-isoprenylcysteine O-methyltransferase Ste14